MNLFHPAPILKQLISGSSRRFGIRTVTLHSAVWNMTERYWRRPPTSRKEHQPQNRNERAIKVLKRGQSPNTLSGGTHI